MHSDFIFKIVILNDFRRDELLSFQKRAFQNHFFDPKSIKATGFILLFKFLNINGYIVSLSTWVISHEKRFRSLFHNFFVGTHGILIMCDITRERTIIEIDKWLKSTLNLPIERPSKEIDEWFNNHPERLIIEKFSTLKSTLKYIPTILVGYITNNEPKIQYEEIRNLAKSHKLDGYAICNLQTGENLEIIFETLATDLIKRYK
ncbi:MAG: hypothetical protein ACFE94_01630 [Candidatus Hodarchaeota archaeon]